VNRKILMILIITIFLSSTVFAVSTVRSASESVEVGKEIIIEISLNLEGENPSSVIILEKIPQGWELVNSSPKATIFEDEMKWLLFGSSLKNQTIEYTLKAPSEFDYAKLNGGWKTLSLTGTTIGREMVFKIVPDAPQSDPQEPMDYTLVLVGVIIVLVIIVAIVVVVLKKKKK